MAVWSICVPHTQLCTCIQLFRLCTALSPPRLAVCVIALGRDVTAKVKEVASRIFHSKVLAPEQEEFEV